MLKKSKIFQKNAKKHKRNCKKERTFALIYPPKAAFPQKCPKKRALFHLFYPPKAAFLHFFTGFSIPFAFFINCFMQNEPNFRAYAEQSEVPARRETQSKKTYVPEGTKTNPI
jgi:hypothetical protein